MNYKTELLHSLRQLLGKQIYDAGMKGSQNFGDDSYGVKTAIDTYISD